MEDAKLAVAVGSPVTCRFTRSELTAALKEIVDDGTYKKINDKYFPFSIY